MSDTPNIAQFGSWAREDHAGVTGRLPSGRSVEIDIDGPRVRFGEMGPAQVNWPSIGAVSPQDAHVFATMVGLAAALANERNLAAGL